VSALLAQKAYISEWQAIMTEALEDARTSLATTATASRIQVRPAACHCN
jgi:hypothetical protein